MAEEGEVFEVQHDPIGQKFFIPLGNTEAILAYTQINNILDIHHAAVPDPYQGKGLAEKMAVFAFEYAKKNGLKIIPTCEYLQEKFLPKHPDYRNIVTSY